MKKIISLLFSFYFLQVYSQGIWTQKTNFGSGVRAGVVGFAIGNKGYIGGGIDSTGSYKKDFWEYDPINNIWTKKANISGLNRNEAIGFSILNKGYVALGYGETGDYNDLWEYDPILNSWSRKADFPGQARYNSVVFIINNKAYIGTGTSENTYTYTYHKDFWEYDPVTDSWQQVANFGGTSRFYATAFAINNKGYVGFGIDSLAVIHDDFWEYDPLTNTWTQSASFPAGPRVGALSFSIDSFAYAGCGQGNSVNKYNDFWKYNPYINTWTHISNFPATPRTSSGGFSLNNKGYVGLGVDSSCSFRKDFWEFTPNTNDINEIKYNNSNLIYPNPFNNTTTIFVDEIILRQNINVELKIYNLLGEEILIIKIINKYTTITRNGLNNGVYLYKITSNNQIINNGKLMIN